MKNNLSIYLGVVCACTLVAVNGCAIDDSARRDDVQNMKSDVNEQLVQVKSLSDQMKWQVDEANKRTETLEKEVATLKSQIIENNKVIEQKLAELSGSIASVDGKRVAGEESMTKKMQVVLDEVSKENERILTKIESKKSKTKKEGSKPKETSKTAGEKKTESVSADGIHTVGDGETFSKIARAYGISVKELMELNEISDPKSLKVGKKLKVPKKSAE